MSIKSHLCAESWPPLNCCFLFFLLSNHIGCDCDHRPAVTDRQITDMPCSQLEGGPWGSWFSTWLSVCVFPTLPSTHIARVCPVVFTAGTGGRAAQGDRRRAELTQKMSKIEEVCGTSPGTHRDASFSFLLISRALRLWLPMPRTSSLIAKAPWSSDSSPSPATVLSLGFLIGLPPGVGVKTTFCKQQCNQGIRQLMGLQPSCTNCT